MKKLSVVLLILVLVAGSVFAAMTPEFSGNFRFGYKFAFGSEVPKGNGVARWKDPAELKLKITFGTDVWKVALKGWNGGELDSDDKISANLTFNIDKVTDMGDHKLAVNMGANSQMTALSVFNDVTGDEYYKFKNNGNITFEARYAFADVVKVNLTVDPVQGNQWNEGKGRSFMISAQGNIVDGVALAAQYAYRPQVISYTWSRAIDIASDVYATTKPSAFDKIAAKNGFGASLNIDIAKLAGLDFMLKFSAHDNFGTGEELESGWLADKAIFNTFVANVQGGVEAVNGYAELAVETLSLTYGDEKQKKTALDLAVGVQTGVVENLPIKVYFKFNDMGNKFEGAFQSFRVGAEMGNKFEGAFQSFRVGAEVFYKGILGLDLGYSKFTKDFTLGDAFGVHTASGAFTITPKMQISF